MAWGNSSNKWGRKPTRSRGKVVWSDNSGTKPAPFMKKLPRYSDPSDPPDGYADHFVVGALWIAKGALSPDPRISDGKYPVLQLAYWGQEQAVVPFGCMMIYAGLERIEERESNGRIVSVPRHTFIAGDGRYIINDWMSVAPVVT